MGWWEIPRQQPVGPTRVTKNGMHLSRSLVYSLCSFLQGETKQFRVVKLNIMEKKVIIKSHDAKFYLLWLLFIPLSVFVVI
jgi:hypothetical protein